MDRNSRRDDVDPSDSSPPATRFALALLALVFVACAVFRAWRVTENVGTYTGCHDCFWLPTLGHDAWLLALVLAILAIGYAVAWRWPGALLRALACLLVFLFVADIAVDLLLAQRLYVEDIVRVGRHVGADLSVARAALRSPAGIARIGVALVLIVLAGLVVRPSPRRPRIAIALAIGAALAAAFSFVALSRPVRYVHQLFTYNVIEANLPQGRMRSFSAPFIAAQRTRAATVTGACSKSAAAPGSVIIVLVESLSAWQSRLLGSKNDWTPELDRIAAANHYFTHFYANGFTTSTAEVSVISARPPLIPAGKTFFDFGDFPDVSGSLVDIAHRSNREAAFFTTGELSFLGLGDWLHGLGFDVVDGSSSPFYKGMKRWQFGAADDRALYDRFLDWLDHRGARPFVATLLTVSTHPPFVDPHTGRIDPERSFKYADAEIGRFYGELEKRGFLDRNVLVVLGDHRTMTPLHADEYRDYGGRAFARIPMVVAGAVDMPRVVDAPFQQTDIDASLADYFGLETCATPFAGRFLRSDPEPPAYVVHTRGDDRNRVDVYWGDAGLAGFRLDGDASAWIGSPPPDAATVAAWIDTHRSGRESAHGSAALAR